MANVSVIIPISKNIRVREKNFKWVEAFYKKMMPDYEICIGESNEQPFPKGKVINDTVKKSSGDILVIADADLIYNPLIIEEGIKLLENHAWVIPFRSVLNITKGSTDRLLKEEPGWPLPIEVETKRRPYLGRGGINIVPRKHFETVGGFDERFKGWGGEDDAFAASLNNLCGHAKRINQEIYHLWHNQRNFSHYQENRKLLRKYYASKESLFNEVQQRKQNNNQ